MATVFVHTLQERQQEEAARVQGIANYGKFLFLEFYIAYDFEIIYKGSSHEDAKKKKIILLF